MSLFQASYINSIDYHNHKYLITKGGCSAA